MYTMRGSGWEEQPADSADSTGPHNLGGPGCNAAYTAVLCQSTLVEQRLLWCRFSPSGALCVSVHIQDPRQSGDQQLAASVFDVQTRCCPAGQRCAYCVVICSRVAAGAGAHSSCPLESRADGTMRRPSPALAIALSSVEMSAWRRACAAA